MSGFSVIRLVGVGGPERARLHGPAVEGPSHRRRPLRRV